MGSSPGRRSVPLGLLCFGSSVSAPPPREHRTAHPRTWWPFPSRAAPARASCGCFLYWSELERASPSANLTREFSKRLRHVNEAIRAPE
jgi:hypothetical protein